MNQSILRTTVVATAATLAISLFLSPSWAQRPSGMFYRMFGEIPLVTLAQLDEVKGALKLSDQQKTKLTELNEELSTKRRDAFMNAQGDFDAMREDLGKLLAEAHKNSLDQLQPEQQTRAEEIYVQVNGPTVLQNEVIAKKLELSEEQLQKLADKSIDSMYDMFDSLQDFQNMSDEERTDAAKKLIESRDEALLAVLTDEQKQKFATMSGEKLEVDLGKLPMPGPR